MWIHSSKKGNAGNKVLVKYSSLESIIPILVLIIFLVFIIGMLIVRFGDTTNKSDMVLNFMFSEENYEDTKVGISFDDITTTTSRFEELKDKCDEYMQFEAIYADTNVEVNTTIDEEQFVDGNTVGINSDGGHMVETGPIYFQDMLMMRYINDLGDMHVITAIYDNNTGTIEVVSKEELIVKLNILGYINNSSKLSSDASTGLPESEYLLGVSEAITKMLLAHTPNEIKDAERIATKYFTLDGNKMVFGNRELIGLMDGSQVRIKHIQAGKSDLSKEYKDRVYVGLELMNGAECIDIYIILKLNTYLRIFDIDIL